MPRTVSRTRYRAASRVKADSAAFCPAVASSWPSAWTHSSFTPAAALATAAASVPLSSPVVRLPAAPARTMEARRSFLFAAATAPATGDRSRERSTASASASRRDSSSGVRATLLPRLDKSPPPAAPFSAFWSDSIATASSALSRSSACDAHGHSDTVRKKGRPRERSERAGLDTGKEETLPIHNAKTGRSRYTGRRNRTVEIHLEHRREEPYRFKA